MVPTSSVRHIGDAQQDQKEHEDRQALDRRPVDGVGVGELDAPAAHLGKMPGDGWLLRRIDYLDLVLKLIVESLVEHQAAPHVAAIDDCDRNEQQRRDRTDHEVIVEQDGGGSRRCSPAY